MTSCEGCGERLDGLVAHIEHICPTPIKKDYPVEDKSEYHYAPMSIGFHKLFRDALKDYIKR